MPVLIVTGTGTEVGKTVVTAAVASTALAHGHTVAVLKPAQTGVALDERGDAAETARLAGAPRPLGRSGAAARSAGGGVAGPTGSAGVADRPGSPGRTAHAESARQAAADVTGRADRPGSAGQTWSGAPDRQAEAADVGGQAEPAGRADPLGSAGQTWPGALAPQAEAADVGGQAEPAGQADPLGSARQAQFGAPARREAVGGTAAQVGGVAVAGQVAGPRAGRGGVGALTVVELARYPEPLAPATAARRAGLAAVSPDEIADAALKLAVEHDLVIVEGAGGLLVRFDEAGGTLADVARLLDAPVLVVAAAGLGTLNVTALTTEALRARGVEPLGVVIGSWPDNPDLAARCNLADLPESAGAPLLGAVPAGAGALAPADFGALAPDWLAPELGGGWDAAEFGARHAAPAATPTPYHSDGTEDARSNAVRPYGDANRP